MILMVALCAAPGLAQDGATPPSAPEQPTQAEPEPSDPPTPPAAEPASEAQEPEEAPGDSEAEPASTERSIEELFEEDRPRSSEGEPSAEEDKAAAGLTEPVLYLTDTDNARVIVMMGLEGEGYSALGMPGYGMGRFLRPQQIWVDYAGRLHIADSGNNRVVRIDQAAQDNLPAWNEVGGFKEPAGVAVDGTSVYISDTKSDRVAVLDELLDEAKVREYLTHPQLRRPGFLWIDKAGALYICAGEDPPGGKIFKTWVEKERRRWQIFDGEGLTGARFLPTSLVTTDSGIVVLDQSGQRILTMRDLNGTRLKEHPMRLDPRYRLRRPTGLGVTPEGRIFLADSGNDRVLEVDFEGGVKGEFRQYQRDPNTALANPSSIFIFSPAPPPAPPEPEESDD